MVGLMRGLKELFERAETWPPEAQDELLRVGIEIESGQGSSYHATRDELEAIDQADEAAIASNEEVAAALAKFRSA